MCLVVPVDKTLHVNHQLGARPPAVVDGASDQDNSFAAPSRHGSSRYAPLERVDHRVNPPTAVVGARISTPTGCWSCRRRLVVSSNAYTICVIAPNKRGRSVSLWRRGCNAFAFIDRTTDRSSRSTNWRTSRSVKPFATNWLTFVASMRRYRARLRNWLGTKRISRRF